MMPNVTVLAKLAALLLSATVPAGVALAQQSIPVPPQVDGQGQLVGPGGAAQQSVPVQVSPQAAAGQHVNAQGHIIAPGAAAAAQDITPFGLTSTACLQLHNGAGVTWNIKLVINPNIYPYPISSGSISGTICSSPWTVTGGSLGPNLQITGVKSPPVPGCATSVGIVGNFSPPAGYNGTYGFFGQTTGFNHHSLFLGFNKPSPC